MSPYPVSPSPPAPALRPPRPRHVPAHRVWSTLTPSQQQHVLHCVITMCQDCLLRTPAVPQPETSHDQP